MKGASLARLARYLVAAFLGAALAALALRRTAMSGGDCEVVGDGVKGPFVLAITVKTKAGRSAEFLKHWGELAAWVRANEPDTLAYEASRVEGDPEKIFVYERYTSKAALHDVHQKSEPFGSFKATMEKLDLFESKEGFGAFETGLGYMAPASC